MSDELLGTIYSFIIGFALILEVIMLSCYNSKSHDLRRK